MPRFNAKPTNKVRTSSNSPKQRKSKAKKKATSDDRAASSPQHSLDLDQHPAWKGKQRQVDTMLLAARANPSDTPFIPGLMVPSSTAAASSAASSATSSPASTASPTSTAVTNPIATLHHNTPLILCIVVGAVIVTTTLSVGLAWLLRLACCASERRARRKRKLDRSTWSPSADVSRDLGNKTEARDSFDSVTVTGDDDVRGKDAKIDLLFNGTAQDGQLGRDVPVLSYTDNKSNDALRSTWNGKGWTLFDPPLAAAIQPPEPASIATRGGGNYGAARQELADCDVGGFTWPTSIERQPSFIDRLVQRHHQSSDLPAAAAQLPYPFQAKPPQPASRMASLGGAANRAVLNMLPVTLRNAATTASRQRATRKRYHDMQPYLDSDFEGTIGAKDRELPMARRLRRTEARMAVDWTTEEEEGDASALEDNGKLLPLSHLHTFPRVQPVLVPSPVISKAQLEFTPGLAGVGAVWSRKASQPSLLPGPNVAVVVRTSMAPERLPKVIEPSRGTLLPFPVLEGDRRTRLLGSVGRWLGQMTEAGEVADPYTALSPRPDRRLTKNGSLRSDYTSTTLADSLAASNSETHVDARTSTSGAGKSERLLERVDADQAEHDRQQRRLLRKARLFAPTTATVDLEAQQASVKPDGSDGDAAEVNVSRAPSIRPQFFATTDLQSWLEPSKVSTTHGLKVLEEHEAASSVGADPFASDADCAKPKSSAPEPRSSKPKLRSSSSKEQLRSSAKNASRPKREMARPSGSTGMAKKASHDALPSACQSSAAITVVSSVFDEAFAAQLDKSSTIPKPTRFSKPDNAAKVKAKAEADAAMREAWRRRRMLSLSSRGSQRSRTTRTTRSQSVSAGALLSRQESLLSQPSVYSELTAPSDYAFRAPLLSDTARSAMLTSCGASTVDAIFEETDAAQHVLQEPEEDAMMRIAEEEAAAAQIQKQLKKQAKQDAKREQRRAERQQAKQAASAIPADSQAIAQLPSISAHRSFQADPSTSLGNTEITGRVIRKQRSILLGAVRSQFAMVPAEADHTDAAPDSPWTSSDSDISIRRWGEPRRDGSVHLHTRGARHMQSSSKTAGGLADAAIKDNKRTPSSRARSNSFYFGMGAGSDLRDLC